MYEQIPSELKFLFQWCCWQSVPDETRPGKIKKIPINAKTGGQAQSNNPETWCNFEEAVSASSRFSGIGFMFSGSGYFGVDIDGVDDAIDDYKMGDADNIIAEFIYSLHTYAEYSYSGHGLHVICRGVLPPVGRRKKNVEMYSEGRYFIMTGNIASDFTEITDCTERIKPLHEKFVSGGSEPHTTRSVTLPMNLAEAEVIRLAEQSKQGGAFSALYRGEWEAYYSSQSEADLAFCNILAFWCRCDEQLMDKIFRNSGLVREKWDRRQSGSTYGKLTLSKAVRGCSRVYEPEPEYHITIGQTSMSRPEYKKIYSLDDTGNAERFSDIFGERVRFSHINKSWLYFDGRKWCFDNTGAIKRMADELIEEMRGELKYFIENAPSDLDTDEAEKAFMKHLKQTRSSKTKIAMIKEAEHRVPITPDHLDAHRSLLNTVNGVVNLQTGELVPHDLNKFMTKITNCEYTDKIDCPLWERFLQDVFSGDQELIGYIQKAIGYSLTGSTKEDCAFFCYGTGRNGKSTFLDVISDALGEYATNIQPETIMVKQNSGGPTSDIARLKGARFVTSSEPNEGVRLNEGLIKQLTGGDKVTASRKYENEFEFYPEFKLWMSMNHKPVIRGTDIGIWSRIRLIPFTVRFTDDKIDVNLKHKLKQELPGILKWTVDGCLRWQREGLKTPSAIAAATNEYKSEMDVITAFLETCCEVGAGEETDRNMYQAYIKWAKDSNEYEMSSRKFNTEMLKRFSRRPSSGNRIYQKVSLINSFKPYQMSFGK